MPAKPESALYRRVKENLPNCHITRIESRVNLGIPDCLVAFPHGEFVMVELKVVKRGRKVTLSPHQVAFHLKHADLRCPTFILVQYYPPKALTVAGSELLLYGGDQALELHKLGIELQPIDRWPWTGVPWNMVRQALLTE